MPDVVRSLVAYLGAADHFTKDHLDIPENRELMEKAHFFYMAVSVIELHGNEDVGNTMVTVDSPQYWNRPLR